MTSTRKYARIRKGIVTARGAFERPFVYGSWTGFGAAYDRETAKLNWMNFLLTQKEKEEYQGLLMSGMFGFANEVTTQRIREIEGIARRRATEWIAASNKARDSLDKLYPTK